MLSASFMPSISEDLDATSTDSWACRITMNGTTLVTEYSEGGGDFVPTKAVKGFTDENGNKTDGSWKYDEQTGYGPFGSFYAAFDPENSNEMVCHLNPYDLTESVDGTSITGQGYNIMWCLPKVYLSVTSSGEGVGTMTMASDESYGGELAPAFTVGGVDYDYLALGVYEATCINGKLGSVSGLYPQVSTHLETYRTEAKANTMVDGSVALLWNFHQYQLYRFCSLAVMDNFNSQAQIGRGNVDMYYQRGSDTGTMDASGPYYGTSAKDDSGVKLFIENTWGSLEEFVDDAWWSDGLYAGQNLNPTSDTSNKTKTTVTSGLTRWGTFPYSTNIDSWGLPTATIEDSRGADTTAPDRFQSYSKDDALIVGGYYYSNLTAGISSVDNYSHSGYRDVGTRLAFLFDNDSAAKLSVRYMDDESELQSDIVRKGQKYSIADPMSTKEGFTLVGWSDGTEVYHPGDSIIVEKDITLTAVWGHTIYTVTFDLKGGTWDRSDTVAAEEGTYAVPSTTPIKSGCTFKEWRCGNDSVLPGGTIDLSSDVTLQAVWASGFIPIIPDSVEPGDQGAVVPDVVVKGHGTWLQKNGKSVLIIAIIVAIIAELAVLCVSRRR